MLDSQVMFAIFCLFATHLEAMIAHAPNDKDRDAMLRQYTKEANKISHQCISFDFFTKHVMSL